MSNEHEHSGEVARQENQLPVEDLTPTGVEAKEAEDVKGGATFSEFHVTKPVDKPSVNLGP
jgi:hypothetical protein